MANTKECPKCGGTAVQMSPIKTADNVTAMYGCKACGHSFTEDGSDFVQSPEQLRDVFRGATMAKQPLLEAFQADKLTAPSKAHLTARMMEYGLQMWMDGFKQGTMLALIKITKEEKENGNG